MRISGIFALGGGCDYGCHDSRKGYYKDYYPYGGYYGDGYRGYYNGYNGPPYYYGKYYHSGPHPACLFGSRF